MGPKRLTDNNSQIFIISTGSLQNRCLWTCLHMWVCSMLLAYKIWCGVWSLFPIHCKSLSWKWEICYHVGAPSRRQSSNRQEKLILLIMMGPILFYHWRNLWMSLNSSKYRIFYPVTQGNESIHPFKQKTLLNPCFSQKYVLIYFFNDKYGIFIA